MKKDISKTENELIDFLRSKSNQISYGQVNVEVVIKKNRMSFVRVVREEETKTFGIDK